MKVKNLLQIVFIFLFLLILNITNAHSINDIRFECIKIPKNTSIYSNYNGKINLTYKNSIYIYNRLSLKKIIKIKELKNKKFQHIISNKTTLILQTNNNELIAIDKINNNIKWKKNITGKLFFTPFLDEKYLFLDENGEIIIALNIEDGSLIWKYKVNMKNFFIYTNGKVLQTHKHLFYIYPNKKIIVLKKDNGEKLKSYKINFYNKNNSMSFLSDFSIYNNIIYLCYDNGDFTVLNGMSGKILWRKYKQNYKYITMHKNNIIITKFNGHITCLNKFNGKKIWTTTAFKDKNIIKPLVLNDIFVTVFDNYGTLYILDKNTGSFLNVLQTKFKNIQHIYKKNKEIIFLTNFEMGKLVIKK